MIAALVLLLCAVTATALIAQDIADHVARFQPVSLWQIVALFPSLTFSGWLAVKAYELGKRTQGGGDGSEVVAIKETLRRLEAALSGLPAALYAISEGQSSMMQLMRDHEDSTKEARAAVMALKDRDDLRRRRHDDE